MGRNSRHGIFSLFVCFWVCWFGFFFSVRNSSAKIQPGFGGWHAEILWPPALHLLHSSRNITRGVLLLIIWSQDKFNKKPNIFPASWWAPQPPNPSWLQESNPLEKKPMGDTLLILSSSSPAGCTPGSSGIPCGKLHQMMPPDLCHSGPQGLLQAASGWCCNPGRCWTFRRWHLGHCRWVKPSSRLWGDQAKPKSFCPWFSGCRKSLMIFVLCQKSVQRRSQSRRLGWVGREIKDQSVPWAGTPSTAQGAPNPTQFGPEIFTL